MLSALEAALRHKGHTVETASNGIDAASKLENSASTVQAVITDLRMPGMDGLELLNHVRRTKPALPVILLSAHGTVTTAVDAMKMGASRESARVRTVRIREGSLHGRQWLQARQIRTCPERNHPAR